MKIVFVVAVSLVALAGLICLWGALLPAGHSVTRQRRCAARPERLFALLTDVSAYPEWRADVRSVDVLGREPLRFREHGKNGDILFEEVERRDAERLVVRIADPALPFGGTWTYTLASEGNDTLLSIREDGVVRNVLFRWISRYVFGHAATIDAYLASLARHVENPD